MARLPTVKVKHPDGYAIINLRDFDPAKHEAYEEPETGSADSTVVVKKKPKRKRTKK
jgi:hypothetical protein